MTTSKLFYDYYDQLFRNKNYASEVETVLRLARRLKNIPQHVLEIGCGTGNHTVELARRVKLVTAIDKDAQMVKRARIKFAQYNLPNIKLHHKSAEKIKLKHCDLAVALFNVVTYVGTFPELILFFKNISRCLGKDGLVIFDLWNGVAALRDPPQEKTSVFKQKHETLTLKIQPQTSLWQQRTRLKYDLTVRTQDKVLHTTYGINQTLWTPAQIESAFTMAGLKSVGIYPFMNLRRPARDSDWKIMYAARKV